MLWELITLMVLAAGTSVWILLASEMAPFRMHAQAK